MSVSTLGAQLAALNGSSQGGSVLPTSKRHEDAVGRGVHHSVQVGHSVVGAKQHLFKASILYQDARQASNVPLTTLKENCIAALEELASEDVKFESYIESICRKNCERGLLTKTQNEELDSQIQDLLYRLALRMTTDNTSAVNCGLNILEFLIRAHDLHIRPKLVATTALVLLPHHEKAYFLRWLQLVDLASLPTFAWLRPYAIPNAKVGRDVIAKAVSKNVALCRELLQLSLKAASLPQAGRTLSFTVAVLVEAMTLQQRATGGLEQRTCQAILPYIKRACSGAKKNPLIANWGYVLASTIVETSCLADEPRRNLVASILQGLGNNRKKKKEEDGDIEMEVTEDVMEDELVQNALIVVLTLLQQQPPSDSYDGDGEEGPKMTSQLTVNGTIIGFATANCINSKDVWKALTAIDNLAGRLGRLLVEDGFLDIAHWLSSIWVVGWKRIEKARSKKSKAGKIQDAEEFLLELLKEDSLFRHLWSKPDWIEALTCFILTNSSVGDSKVSRKEESLVEKVLNLLRAKNITAYEKGVARALLKSKRAARSQLATYLGLTGKDSEDAIGNPSEEPSIILPPRVALDHADVEVRLEAIDRLLQENGHGMETDGETVEEALIRRVLSDDDAQVAIKASKALCDLLDPKNRKKKDHSKIQEFADFSESALEAISRWTEHPDTESKVKSPLLCHLLHVASICASKIREVGFDALLVARLVEALGANLAHADAHVVNEAAKGIVRSLTKGKGTKASDNEARESIMAQDLESLVVFARDDGSDVSSSEQMLRRRFLPSLLKGYSESLSQRSSKSIDQRGGAAMDYCLWAIRVHGNDLSNDERELLADVLKRCADYVAADADKLPSIFSAVLESDEILFEKACNPFILEVCKAIKCNNGKSASSLSILSEFALRPGTSTVCTERLLLIAKNVVSQQPSTCHLGIIPAAALLTHTDSTVRKEALALLSEIGKAMAAQTSSGWNSVIEFHKHIAENESTAIMGSPSLLSNSLRASCLSSSRSSEFQKCWYDLILATFLSSTVESLTEPSKMDKKGWINFDKAFGGHEAVGIVLTATQEAGESAFSLESRWKHLGKPLLDVVLSSDLKDSMPATLEPVLTHIILMLKGTKHEGAESQNADSSSNVIITSGPAARGGRRRSYSFGKTEAGVFLSPYPKDMLEMVVNLLSSKVAGPLMRSMRNILSDRLLSSASWGKAVFSKQSPADREKVITAVLRCTSEDLADSSESAFFLLPLTGQDVSRMLSNTEDANSDQSLVSYIGDFVSSNVKTLACDSSAGDVLVALFEVFRRLSSVSTTAEPAEFTRASVLEAMANMLDACNTEGAQKLELDKKKKFKEWVAVLVQVINPGSNSKYLGLSSNRGTRLTLSVLTSLCSLYPASVAEKMIPAMVSMVIGATSEKQASVVSELLSSIVPVYLSVATSANLTIWDLISAFLDASKTLEENSRVHLCQGFIESLLKYENSDSAAVSGSFLACCIANDVFIAKRNGVRSKPANLVSQILNNVPVSRRIQTILTVASYVRDLALVIGGEEKYEDGFAIPLPTLQHLSEAGTKENKVKSKKASSTEISKNLCLALTTACGEVVSSQSFARYLRSSKTESSAIVVRLWQDLLITQSVCNNQLGISEGQSERFWSDLSEMSNETLDCVQSHLPVPIFLAFATSLVKESESEDLRARALQLIADRSVLLDALDSESHLFFDMIPYLTTLLVSSNDENSNLRQAALVAIEHIARKALSDKEGVGTKYVETVAKSLDAVASLIESEVKPAISAVSVGSTTIQLLCTAALCAATATRVCGARALPCLPKLLRPSFRLLAGTNEAIEQRRKTKVDKKDLRVLQLSLLRLFTAVVDTIPQFLAPHLADMFKPSVLRSRMLQESPDEQGVAVNSAIFRLREAIATKVPARQLLNPLIGGMQKAKDEATLTALLDILVRSIRSSKASEISTNSGLILKGGTFVFEFAQDHSSCDELISLSTDMFMSLVLKLSELQLRSLFSKLRSWRGDFDSSNPNASAFKRFCFWNLSSALAKELKTIFLPCLTAVFSDVVDELDNAVACLTKRAKSSGAKKQRLDGDTVEYDRFSLLSLQSVMKCVAASLRSDAHDGGSWLRDSEAERFDLLMEPVGKLFTCRIPEGCTDHISYQDLVHGGNEEKGCVAECMVSLALAAGDEQKWKPLNHAVLQACSNETRAEVRKAGVTCLLSLIKSIGEEYMVLIPECLPVLSELLEETDEEMSELAQECIGVSEELLGESLEDNLR